MADDLLRARRWAMRADPRTAVRTVVVWEALDALVAELVASTGRAALDVVDLGGGTGGFAVPLAGLGHRVTVVDPSPDALAALQRRAAEAGIADRVVARQGDAATLGETVPAGSADLVLCHGVLEHVDDPAAAAAAALAVLRPGGIASLLVAQRLGAVLGHALAGRFADARRLVDTPADTAGTLPADAPAATPDGPAGPAGPALGGGDPVRRFDADSLLALLHTPVEVRLVHGVRLVTDLLPGALVDGDPATAEALLALERVAAEHPALSAVAAQMHVAVRLPGVPPGD